MQALRSGLVEAGDRRLEGIDGLDQCDGVIGLLPALKSPTVSKLFGEDGFAVETVVAKSEINILIPALKDAGATDIIELPLSKIVH